MTTAAIYAPPDQNQDLQMSDLRRYALDHCWALLEYPERDARAGTRPVWSQMLRHAEWHRFDVLVVQSVDGIARSLAELYDLLTWLHGFGVWLVATNESIDTNQRTNDGRSFISNLAILVNAEKNMRCRNVREGLARAQSKGAHCGRPRHDFPSAQAWKLRQQGLTIREIAAILGLPASTVGAAFRGGDGRFAKANGDMIAGKDIQSARPRRTFPLLRAKELREGGLSFRAVAAEIGFPVSTVATALRALRSAQTKAKFVVPEWTAPGPNRSAELRKALPWRAVPIKAPGSGFLWTLPMIGDTRVEKAPDMVRIVVAVDPSITHGEDFRESGIVVVGRSFDGHAYVFRDLSCRLSPNGLGRLAINAYREFRADRIITDVFKGGNLFEGVLRAIDSNISYKTVHASHGKVFRAEAISALYEQRKVHHVGLFAELETQMYSFVPDNLSGSSRRVDALVLALIELMFPPPDEELSEDYGDQ